MLSRRSYAWEKSYPAGVRWDCPIATSTFAGLLERAVADYAIGRRWNIATGASAIAILRPCPRAQRHSGRSGWIALRVALYLPNTPWHPVAFFGALRTGPASSTSVRSMRSGADPQARGSGARTIVTVNLFGL